LGGGEGGEASFLERDQAAGELQEGEVVLVLLRPADQERPVAVQPGVAGLDDPATGAPAGGAQLGLDLANTGYSGQVTLESTIVAEQTGSQNCTGPISDGGYNIEDEASCGLGTANNSLSSTNPLLDPAGLKDNGGPTQTIPLMPGSPAVDAIPPGVSGCGTTLTNDQRGVSRPQGSGCDIGAFELVLTLTVAIDIKPGGFPNPINPQSKGTIPVAILSASGFNAPSQVDTTSLKFGRTGNESSLAFCSSPQDVTGDGLLDLVCHFSTQKTGFQAGDTQGVLTGKTVSGTPIRGTDSVVIVPPT